METLLSESLRLASSLTSSPDDFLQPQKEKALAFAKLAKTLHDVDSVTNELVIEGMDEEQLFAGLEITNADLINKTKGVLSKPNLSINLAKGLLIVETTNRTDVHQVNEGNSSSDEEQFDDNDDESRTSDVSQSAKKESDDVFDDPDFQHMSDSDLDDLPLFDKDDDDGDDDDDDDDGEEGKGDDEEEDEGIKAHRASRRLEVEQETESYMSKALASMRSKIDKNEKNEDKVDFLQLEAMDNFLDAQDRLEQRRIEKEEKGEQEERDDDVDLFDDDDDDNDEGNAKYEDFFGNNEDFHVSNSQSDEDDDDASRAEQEEGLIDAEEGEEMNRASCLEDAKSSFERSQQRLQSKIESLEASALKPLNDDREWQLTGEISADSRPENSLLQEHLDYNTTSKKAPIITEAVSINLEQLIKQRIKDGAWDDVERKIKPADLQSLGDYKRKLVLDEQKSKLSLAEIYEQEYLAQREEHQEMTNKKVDTSLMLKADNDENLDENDEESKAIKRIREEMNDLFAQLDALSHFHYIPKARTAEVRVLDNVGTVQVEEAAPITFNDSHLLAPQEVLNIKNRAMNIEKSERSETDKKRARRKKKVIQKRIGLQKREKNSNASDETMSAAKRLKRSNGKKSDEGHDTKSNVGSSVKFFAALQEQQQTTNNKSERKTRVKREQGKSGAQLKL